MIDRILRDRIMRKTRVEGNCLLWTAATGAEGYARLGYQGSTFNHVHRLMWEWERGDIPPLSVLMNECGRPNCLNVDHWVVGTHAELQRRTILTKLGSDLAFPWSRVTKHPGDGCWDFQGSTSNGYGKIGRKTLGRGAVPISAHRLAWEVMRGPIPDGLFVLHHCDNRRCVKTEGDSAWPDGHLFLGTARDNMRDMIAKGRAPWQQASR